jgi:4'-phosphopantetheinyl transferase
VRSLTARGAEWSPPPGVLTVSRGEVHVWRASLDVTPRRRTSLLATLSSDERARADRFHFERDRHHFITGRGLLRAILARYLETAPAALQFHYDAHGKPRLAGAFPDRLRFNVSHSHGLALYAVSVDRELGVDLERIEPRLETGIAERFFSPREVATLRALPTHAQRDAFFACWTRKEAYVKARGEGLTLCLDQFEVSLSPGEPAALLRTAGDPDEARRWSLEELAPEPGYAAALAVEGRDWGLRCWSEG